MIWFALFLIIASIAIGIFIHPSSFGNRGSINPPQIKQYLVIGLLSAGLALILFSSLTTVSSGHVGVQVIFGKVNTEGYLGEGLHLKNPLAEITEMSIRTQTYTMSAVSDEGTKKGRG